MLRHYIALMMTGKSCWFYPFSCESIAEHRDMCRYIDKMKLVNGARAVLYEVFFIKDRLYVEDVNYVERRRFWLG